ncbi:MAG: MerR family transcriptional regulator [Marinilabiliales bacterium]|nr:MerR family transcriptional regulator [Marinilabiliales bacterium]
MNAGSRTYSIKDLENYCGIKAHTIRMWEKRYEILRPERSDSNIRHYTEEELKKLITISMLNRNGLKISKIARLSDNELLKEVMKQGTGDEQSDGSFKPGELIMSALRFSEDQFRERLSPFIAEKGMREAYIKIFHPLMQKAKSTVAYRLSVKTPGAVYQACHQDTHLLGRHQTGFASSHRERRCDKPR